MFSPDDRTRETIVRPHIHDTRCFVTTAHPPCTETAREQQAANRMILGPSPRGRDIVLTDYDHIAKVALPKSWLLIALLCAGDDIAPLATWVKQDVRPRVDRVRFYHHEKTDPATILKAWVDAGLPFPRIDSFRDQRALSARFGQDILLQIVDDWGPRQDRPPV